MIWLAIVHLATYCRGIFISRIPYIAKQYPVVRPILLYLLMILCSTCFGQRRDSPNVLYVGSIPLVVRSGLYIDSLPLTRSLYTLDDRIHVMLAPRRTKFETEHTFSAGKPISIAGYADIEYRFGFDGGFVTQWRPLDLPKEHHPFPPYGGTLVDTPFGDHRLLEVQFRDRWTKRLVQQNSFERLVQVPVVTGYRIRAELDSLDNNIKSRAVRSTKKNLGGYDYLTTEYLDIPSGRQAELQIAKRALSIDSCVEFRLLKNGKHADTTWHLTGHLLSISNIQPGSSYLLQLRYAGSRQWNTYRLNAMPFWYQTKLGIGVLVGSGVLLLTACPYWLYRYLLRKESSKRFQIEEQLKKVQSQLNPHFVYNALSSIEGLVSNMENERANEYLTTFSDIMRQTLHNSSAVLIRLSDDITMLEKYIQIEQLRFEFRYQFSIDPGLDLDAVEFPPMLLQPTVENAVKHGLAGMGADGRLKINYSKDQNDLLVKVTDNGKSSGTQHKGGGYGTKFTRERIGYLQKLYKKEPLVYSFEQSDNGFTVKFTFKNWLA